jgi:hypothetical protein
MRIVLDLREHAGTLSVSLDDAFDCRDSCDCDVLDRP